MIRRPALAAIDLSIPGLAVTGLAVLLVMTACGSPGPGGSDPAETNSQETPAHAHDETNSQETPAHAHDETQRMARRLELIVSNSPAQASFFRNHERLESLRSLALPDDPDDLARAQLGLAVEALRAGESREAVAGLTSLLERVTADPEQFPEGLERRIRRQLATAHLRVGEQDNCLDGHHAEACLLPIQGGGVHQRQEGSRAALAELTVLLDAEPDDLMLRWLYNLASMTLGEYPDGVPEVWRIPPENFEAEAPFPRFADVAPGVGLDTVSLAGGVVVDDLDGDGHLDVAVSSWGAHDPLRIFLARPQEGRLVYEEHTELAGVSGLTGGLNLIHADYDNDGDIDLFVLRGAWQYDQGRHPNSLLRNDGAAGFEDVTESSGLLSFHPTQTAAWADYDLDGWLDLFIGNESAGPSRHPSELYRNLGPDTEGRVTFREVAVDAGVAANDYVKGVAWGDIDNDGWPDLYLSTIRGPNRLYRNLGDADGVVRFEEIAAEAGVDRPVDSFPTWFFDADNDGDHDLFVADYGTDFRNSRATSVVAGILGQPVEGSVSKLYRNRGDGVFDDVAADTRLALPMLVMGANFGDLDNDGWLDLYLGTGAPDYQALIPNRMFRNVLFRDGTAQPFEDITTSGGFGHLQKGHGIAFADLDHDGDQDVLAVMGGAFSGDVYPNALFENPGAPGRWITLRLEGALGNRSAVGARIRVDLEGASGGRSVYATVSSGGSFGASSLQQEIGLGDASTIRRLVVRWPGGLEQTFDDVPMDRIHRLVEGDSQPTPMLQEPLRIEAQAVTPHHHGPR